MEINIAMCLKDLYYNTKKENTIFSHLPFPALALNILCDIKHNSPKFLVGRRAHSPSRMHRYLKYLSRIGMVLSVLVQC